MGTELADDDEVVRHLVKMEPYSSSFRRFWLNQSNLLSIIHSLCVARDSSMLAKVLSAALVGIDAHLIDVEVDIAGGLPQFSVVGLPDATVRESRDRVRSALKNTGFHFPAKKITVNLAPAGIKKEGAGFDLAIAIGILVAEEVISPRMYVGRVCVGELSLDGHIKAITRRLVHWDCLPAQTTVCSCRLRTARRRPWYRV